MPKYSIVIPVYNVEHYLSECVSSILNQSFTDYEILLVDDGSTDGSGKMCDELATKDNRIVVIHQKNGGLGMARNAGIRRASGKWLLFVDSDDLLYPESLLSIDKHIVDDCNIYVCNWIPFCEANGERSFMKPVGCDHNEEIIYNSMYTQVEEYNTISGWAIWKMIISRQLIVEQKLFFLDSVRNGEDVFWVLSLFSVENKIEYLSEVLYYYRKRSSGTLSEVSPQNAIRWLDSMAITYRELACRDFTNREYLLSVVARKAWDYLPYAYGTVRSEWKQRRKTYINISRSLITHHMSKVFRFVGILSQTVPGIEIMRLIVRKYCDYRRKKSNEKVM